MGTWTFVSTSLQKRGWRRRAALLAEYYVDLVFQQVIAIVPITVSFQILTADL